jgi:5'-methylthioadenosine phosphorylase
VRYQKSR